MCIVRLVVMAAVVGPTKLRFKGFIYRLLIVGKEIQKRDHLYTLDERVIDEVKYREVRDQARKQTRYVCIGPAHRESENFGRR